MQQAMQTRALSTMAPPPGGPADTTTCTHLGLYNNDDDDDDDSEAVYELQLAAAAEANLADARRVAAQELASAIQLGIPPGTARDLALEIALHQLQSVALHNAHGHQRSSGSGGRASAATASANTGSGSSLDSDDLDLAVATIAGAGEEEQGEVATCGICLESMGAGRFHALAACRHRFCRVCLSKYVDARLQTPAARRAWPRRRCAGGLDSGGRQADEVAVCGWVRVPCPEPGCRAGLGPEDMWGLLLRPAVARWVVAAGGAGGGVSAGGAGGGAGGGGRRDGVVQQPVSQVESGRRAGARRAPPVQQQEQERRAAAGEEEEELEPRAAARRELVGAWGQEWDPEQCPYCGDLMLRTGVGGGNTLECGCGATFCSLCGEEDCTGCGGSS